MRRLGISDEDLVEVRRRFHDPVAATRARESHRHSSQREEVNADNTVDLTFEVGGLLEIAPWILSWGGTVEGLTLPTSGSASPLRRER